MEWWGESWRRGGIRTKVGILNVYRYNERGVFKQDKEEGNTNGKWGVCGWEMNVQRWGKELCDRERESCKETYGVGWDQ